MKCYARSYQLLLIFLIVLLFVPATILGEGDGIGPERKSVINCKLVAIDLINSYIEVNVENLTSDDIKFRKDAISIGKLLISNRNGDKYLVKSQPTSGLFLFGRNSYDEVINPSLEYIIPIGILNGDEYVLQPFAKANYQFSLPNRYVIIPLVGGSSEIKFNSGDQVHYICRYGLSYKRNKELDCLEFEHRGDITFQYSSDNEWNVIWLPDQYLNAFIVDYWYARAKQKFEQIFYSNLFIVITSGIISIILIVIYLKKVRSKTP